ncbi:MAG: hypothetical protein J0L63_05535 [Anaerolineae bacterium]|nr:hypothetical protein [Anaerolineae bacterium]MBN8618344.1 hypothetical protein [Anaerolineae bacterium]
MTSQPAAPRAGSEQFDELMQAGRSAHAMGNEKEAHEYWKEAARLNPYDEQVWLALLSVITSDSDRLVCLQNVIQINPMNVQARRQLNKLEARRERAAQYRSEKKVEQKSSKRRRRSVLFRSLALGVLIGLAGVVFGVVLSILVYAT